MEKNTQQPMNLHSLPPSQEGADWKNFNDGYKAGAEEMRDGLLQLCKDFSDRQNRPYMGDVLAQVNSLCDLVLSEIPRSLEQQAESVVLTNEQIEELWWGELDNRSLGCIRNIIAAAHQPRIAELESRLLTVQVECDKFKKIAEKAIAYRDAYLLTEYRVNDEEFWKYAEVDDQDDVDLEETLAKNRLFAIIDELRKEKDDE